MRQELTADSVSRVIPAPAAVLYDLVADVTRTPQRAPDIVRCEWLDGATGPAVGARFKSVNRSQGRGWDWSNKPVVTTVIPDRAFSFQRTELIGGTLAWRHRFEPVDGGTEVTIGYEVIKPIPLVGWFMIGTLYGLKDRRRDLRASIEVSLDRLAALAVDAAAADAAAAALAEPPRRAGL